MSDFKNKILLFVFFIMKFWKMYNSTGKLVMYFWPQSGFYNFPTEKNDVSVSQKKIKILKDNYNYTLIF